MKTIYLEIERRQSKQKCNVISKHLWYDVLEGKMHAISGGVLRFKYDLNQKRMIPYAEDLVISKSVNSDNKEHIMSWIHANKHLVTINDAETTNNSIAVDVNDSDVEYVTSMFDRCGFRYE